MDYLVDMMASQRREDLLEAARRHHRARRLTRKSAFGPTRRTPR